FFARRGSSRSAPQTLGGDAAVCGMVASGGSAVGVGLPGVGGEGPRGASSQTKETSMRKQRGTLTPGLVVKGGGGGQQVILVERIQDLSLSDAQEAKIAEIRKDCEPKVKDAAKELAGLVKEEEQKLGEVLTAEQKQKIQALKEERKDYRSECLAHTVAHLKELDLTDAE